MVLVEGLLADAAARHPAANQRALALALASRIAHQANSRSDLNFLTRPTTRTPATAPVCPTRTAIDTLSSSRLSIHLSTAG